MTVLYTPLNIPKIVPNDWDQWWDVWNKNTDKLTKKHKTHNPTYGSNDVWNGVTLYQSPNSIMTYDCPDVSDTPVAKNISEQVLDNIPCRIMCIRVIENLHGVGFHTDHSISKQQLRSILWSTYHDPVWYFRLKEEIKQFSLPEDTNTFFYVDNPLEHAAIYDRTKSKGLLWIYGYQPIDSKLTALAESSAEKFKQYAWVI